MGVHMKKLLAVILLILPISAFAQTIQAGIGADLFRYEKTFLDLHAMVLQPVKQDVELFLGGSFALATEKENGSVEADFFIPIDGGVNFLFPVNPEFSYTVGFGLSAQFLIDSDTHFYMGPFVKLGLRYQMHPYMTWYLEALQDLVIGKPDWINNSTRFSTGILFHF
jgi:hypothetical protein